MESSVQVGEGSGLGHTVGHWGLETRRVLWVLELESMLFLQKGQHSQGLALAEKSCPASGVGPLGSRGEDLRLSVETGCSLLGLGTLDQQELAVARGRPE